MSLRYVALLAEGVDRNNFLGWVVLSKKESPSSRRAWIEMIVGKLATIDLIVALLAEGVDRNLPNSARMQKAFCRPPRGGRG